MKQIVILGAGPAACFLALSLARKGHAPLVIGQLRRKPAAEGLSLRVVEALERFGAKGALSLLGPRWRRISSWNGEEVEMNGEFVIERAAFDSALFSDVDRAGVAIRQGRVRALARDAGATWSFEWTDESGRLQQTCADLIVECRGHAAPRSAPDIHRGSMFLSLGRSFEGACPQRRTTFVESFEHGWAWGGVDVQGRTHIQTVVLPDMVNSYKGNLDAAHAACLPKLPKLLKCFGGALRPTGPTRARGIQPALRSEIATADFLRVGDAAYTCDPLSGHGIFEAASGAIAAVPVIQTLLDRPDDSPLALSYFVERASSVFFSRVQVAHWHYASEMRWSDAQFWQRACTHDIPSLGEPGSPKFAVRPVVEEGYIVARRVVVSEEHPRGVRFIDGIDLGHLDERINASPVSDLAALSASLNAPAESIRHALKWLQQHKLAHCAVL